MTTEHLSTVVFLILKMKESGRVTFKLNHKKVVKYSHLFQVFPQVTKSKIVMCTTFTKIMKVKPSDQLLKKAIIMKIHMPIDTRQVLMLSHLDKDNQEIIQLAEVRLILPIFSKGNRKLLEHPLVSKPNLLSLKLESTGHVLIVIWKPSVDLV